MAGTSSESCAMVLRQLDSEHLEWLCDGHPTSGQFHPWVQFQPMAGSRGSLLRNCFATAGQRTVGTLKLHANVPLLAIYTHGCSFSPWQGQEALFCAIVLNKWTADSWNLEAGECPTRARRVVVMQVVRPDGRDDRQGVSHAVVEQLLHAEADAAAARHHSSRRGEAVREGAQQVVHCPSARPVDAESAHAISNDDDRFVLFFLFSCFK